MYIKTYESALLPDKILEYLRSYGMRSMNGCRGKQTNPKN